MTVVVAWAERSSLARTQSYGRDRDALVSPSPLWSAGGALVVTTVDERAEIAASLRLRVLKSPPITTKSPAGTRCASAAASASASIRRFVADEVSRWTLIAHRS